MDTKFQSSLDSWVNKYLKTKTTNTVLTVSYTKLKLTRAAIVFDLVSNVFYVY